MHAVICELTLFIPEANSLKAKRQVVKRIVERIKSRCNASVAETDYQDTWQRAVIAVAIVGSTRTIIEQQVNLLRRIVDDTAGAEVTSFDIEYI
jgi:uncharacterized protein YlxP (DUF503 family)